MAVVGYARVSSVGQSLELQVEKLKEYGCTKIYQEKKSALDLKRPELIKCLDYVRDKEDTLVITKLDRIARSSLHLGKIVEQLKDKEVNFVVIDQHIDTTTIYGRLTFQILSSVAEFENEIRRERQQEGIEKAKRDGKKLGRKMSIPIKTIQTIVDDIKAGLTVSAILKKNGVSNGTFYRIKNGDYDEVLATQKDFIRNLDEPSAQLLAVGDALREDRDVKITINKTIDFPS